MDGGKQKTNKSKLEKADILEMTVDFVKRSRTTTKDGQDGKSTDKDPSTVKEDHYTAGYDHCRKEITSLIKDSQHITDDLRQRLLQHLQNMKDNKDKESLEKENSTTNRQKEVLQSFHAIVPKSLDTPSNGTTNQITCDSKEENPRQNKTNDSNIIICAAPLPAYLLVPTAPICHVLPIAKQGHTTLNQSNGGDTASSNTGTQGPPTSTSCSCHHAQNFVCNTPATFSSSVSDMFVPNQTSNYFKQYPVPNSMNAANTIDRFTNFLTLNAAPTPNLQTEISQSSSPGLNQSESMWRPW